MATVLERFKKLGLAYSPAVLSVVGKHIANLYYKRFGYYKIMQQKYQREGKELITVNDYPEEFITDMDGQIIQFISKPQNKIYLSNLVNNIKKIQSRRARQNWEQNQATQ